MHRMPLSKTRGIRANPFGTQFALSIGMENTKELRLWIAESQRDRLYILRDRAAEHDHHQALARKLDMLASAADLKASRMRVLVEGGGS